MGELFADTVKVQVKKPNDKGFLVTIPEEVATKLGLRRGDKANVYFDPAARQWTYRIVP